MVVGNMPLVIMGMPVPVAVVLGFLISVTLIVQHSNVDARLGPLRAICRSAACITCITSIGEPKATAISACC